jgi:hypothetical protein
MWTRGHSGDCFTLAAPTVIPANLGLAPARIQSRARHYNLGLAYRIATPVGRFVPRVDISHRGKTYFDAPNTEEIVQRGYEAYNASLRFQSNDERVAATAGVTNFTDEEYR